MPCGHPCSAPCLGRCRRRLAGWALALALARAARHFVFAAILAIFGRDTRQYAFAQVADGLFGGLEFVVRLVHLREQGVIRILFGLRRHDLRAVRGQGQAVAQVQGGVDAGEGGQALLGARGTVSFGEPCFFLLIGFGF